MLNARMKKEDKNEGKDDQLEMITSALVKAFFIAAVIKIIYFVYTTYYSPGVEEEL